MKKLVFTVLVISLSILAACTTGAVSPAGSSETQVVEVPSSTPQQAAPPQETTEASPSGETQAPPAEPTALPEPTLEPINPPENPTPEPGAYPSTPETVVYAFLGAYQEDPNQMAAYLSQNLLSQIPDGNIYGVLGFNTPLEGFVFQAGTGDTQTAFVDVSLQTGGVALQRIFHLVMQNGLWAIDQIETP